MAENSSDHEAQRCPTQINHDDQSKEVIASKICGTVKWFNVKSGYGFINRNDTKEDIFVHQTAILKNNPKKAVRSVGDGEAVEFDVVVGKQGYEAANVTGPGGNNVKGSQFAADKRRFRRSFKKGVRGRSIGRMGGGSVDSQSGGECQDNQIYENQTQMRPRGGGRGSYNATFGRGRARGSRGRFGMNFNKNGRNLQKHGISNGNVNEQQQRLVSPVGSQTRQRGGGNHRAGLRRYFPRNNYRQNISGRDHFQHGNGPPFQSRGPIQNRGRRGGGFRRNFRRPVGARASGTQNIGPNPQ